MKVVTSDQIGRLTQRRKHGLTTEILMENAGPPFPRNQKLVGMLAAGHSHIMARETTGETGWSQQDTSRISGERSPVYVQHVRQ